jgi:hypothetical protein
MGVGCLCDTMGERIGRIGQIETDFFCKFGSISKQKNKKIRLYPPDPLNPFSHCITKASCAKYSSIILELDGCAIHKKVHLDLFRLEYVVFFLNGYRTKKVLFAYANPHLPIESPYSNAPFFASC